MKWTRLIKAKKNTSFEDLFKIREVRTNNSSDKRRQKIIDLMLKEGIKRRNVDPDVVYDFALEHNMRVSFDDMLWIANNYPNNKKIK